MARTIVNFRLGEEPRRQLQAWAYDHHLHLSHVIRACLAVAFNHPKEVHTMLDDIAARDQRLQDAREAVQSLRDQRVF